MAALSELVLADGQQVVKTASLPFHGGALLVEILPLPGQGCLLFLRLAGQVLDVNPQLVLEGDVLPDILLQLLDKFLVQGGHRLVSRRCLT